ncbi:DUF58 domain-containing protein [Melittangium boletus]|uniref:DUF58 domain-containing protein n=1 Tax=Melittangium boletus DSM 14713 TaxID=1294270 RepID=A0A250IDA9_9BACT|nr:DUF58 domain-containing protein [Melittangium boletus]ATB29755.1 hypothetical protein MEBOL_003210 [Melittangium boletus DSM 14713]
MAPPRRWSFFMPAEEHGFIRVLADRYHGWFTPVGRVVMWTALATGFLLLGGLVTPLILFFSFAFIALAAAVLVGLPFRPRVSLTRLLPPPVSAGDMLSYRVRVLNTGRRPVRHLVVEERGLPAELRRVDEPPVIDVLAPGESTEVTLRLKCTTRGVYVLGGLQAASVFPAGLVKSARRSGSQDRLLVYPRFTPLDALDVPHGRNHQPGGIAVASQVGESTEFSGTRDWHEGDRTRDIHWPSFARTGRLVVKEYQEEFFVRLALVLDVQSRSRREDELLERALSLAAGLADVLARQEYLLDVFAAGSRVFHFQAGRALAHVEHILEILAAIESGERLDVDALEAVLLPEASRLSAVLFVVMDWEPRRAALVARLEERGVAVRVFAVRSDGPPEELAPEARRVAP